jgi:hypothetical protein
MVHATSSGSASLDKGLDQPILCAVGTLELQGPDACPLFLLQNVSETPGGMDEFLVGIAVHLFSQIVYININDVGKTVENIVPYIFRYGGAGQDLVRIAHEEFE